MRRRAALAAAVLVAAVLLPVQHAQAAAKHVGLVVRFANGTVATACAAVGGSGLAVLERKFSVVIGQAPPYAGFVFKINDVGTTHPDSTHYWSYWHLVAGAWQYSSGGAGSYTPKAGSVEGWSFVNGQSTAPKPPKHSYGSLCGGLDPQPAPPAAPSTSTTHAPPPAHVATTATAPTTRPAATQPRPPTTSTTSAAGHAPESARTSAASSPATRVTTRSSTAPPSSPGTSPAAPSTTAVAAARRADPSGDGDGDGLHAWGTALALILVAGLGATAFVFMRRRSA